MELSSKMSCSIVTARMDSGIITTAEPPHLLEQTALPESSEAVLRLLLKDWGRLLVTAFAQCPILGISAERLLWRRYEPETRTALYAMLGHRGAPPAYPGMPPTDTQPPALLIDPLMDLREPPPAQIADDDNEDDEDDDFDLQ